VQAITTFPGCLPWRASPTKQSTAAEKPGTGTRLWLAHFWLGLNLEQKGKYREAISELKKSISQIKNMSVAVGALGHAHSAAGHKSEAEKILRNLRQLSDQTYVDPFAIAQVCVGLEEHDKVFEWLDRACDARSPFMILFLKEDPRLDKLRGDPRFNLISYYQSIPRPQPGCG
jgi:tetratricopeptide (TPR) repeat protein